MKPATPAGEKDLARDLKTFEQRPAKARELDLLKDQAERATGEERATVDQKIRAKSQ